MDAPPNDPGLAGDAEGTAPPPSETPPAPARKSAFAFFAIVLVLFAALGTVAQAANPALGLAWSEIFALLLPAVIAAAGSNLDATRALLLARRPRGAALALAALVGVAGFFAAGALMALTSLALPVRWVETFDVTRIFDVPPLQRVALGVLAATVAPFCEEVAFRGWILTALRTRHRTRTAIAASALFFALMHLDPVRFTALLVLGAVYAWLAWRAGSIWPAVVAHAANNGLGVVLAGFQRGESSLAAAHARPLQVAFASAVTLSIMGAVLQLAAAAYRRSAGPPPPIEDLVVRRNPADPSTAFDMGRIHRPLLAMMAVAAGTLALLLASARHGR